MGACVAEQLTLLPVPLSPPPRPYPASSPAVSLSRRAPRPGQRPTLLSSFRRLLPSSVPAWRTPLPAHVSRCFNFFSSLFSPPAIGFTISPRRPPKHRLRSSAPFSYVGRIILKIESWKLQCTDSLFYSRIQISEMQRTLRPDVAPCSAEDGAPICAEVGACNER